MSQRAKELAERLTAFNGEIIAFVENCSDEDWTKVCSGEQWSVGVVARHLAAGHYGVLNLVKLVVSGEPLPDITMEAIDQMNAEHAEEHADCTRAEVLSLLRENGSSIAEYVAGLGDEDLDRAGHLVLLGGDVSAWQVFERVILQSGGEHLASMKAAAGS